MCRKNIVLAAALIAFGAGLLAGLLLESCIVTFFAALVSIAGGLFLLKLI